MEVFVPPWVRGRPARSCVVIERPGRPHLQGALVVHFTIVDRLVGFVLHVAEGEQEDAGADDRDHREHQGREVIDLVAEFEGEGRSRRGAVRVGLVSLLPVGRRGTVLRTDANPIHAFGPAGGHRLGLEVLLGVVQKQDEPGDGDRGRNRHATRREVSSTFKGAVASEEPVQGRGDAG